MRATAGIHHRDTPEAVDRLRDRPAIPVIQRAADLRVAPGDACRIGCDGGVERGERPVAEQAAGRRHLATRKIQGGRAAPVQLEQRLHAGDGLRHAPDQRVAAAGMEDRRLEDVGQRQRPPVAQQRQPGAEGAGHAGGEMPAAGDRVEAQPGEMRDRGGVRRGTLAADHRRRVVAGSARQDRHLAAGTVQMRLDDLEHEARGDGGVESVAAAFEHAHAGGGGDPVRRGDGAEGSLEIGAGRECHCRLQCSADGRSAASRRARRRAARRAAAWRAASAGRTFFPTARGSAARRTR